MYSTSCPENKFIYEIYEKYINKNENNKQNNRYQEHIQKQE